MSYDQKCYDLAWDFLSDIQEPVKPADADRLAQEIQQTIEDYLEEVESRDKPAANEPPPALKLEMEREPVEDDESYDRRHQPPPALKAEVERDIRNAVSMGKAWDKVFDSVFKPKRS